MLYEIHLNENITQKYCTFFFFLQVALFCNNSFDTERQKVTILTEANEEAKPLISTEANSSKHSSPNHLQNNINCTKNDNSVSKEETSDLCNHKEKPPNVKSVKLVENTKSLASAGNKFRQKSQIIRKATAWRKKSRQSLHLKNEDRERKATETLAVVLGKKHCEISKNCFELIFGKF